jgi:hypothetical protein
LCHTSNEELRSIYHSRTPKANKKKLPHLVNKPVKEKTQRVYENYQELMVFQTDDQILLNCLFNTIWNHNLDEDHEVFMVFFPQLMNKVAAAMTI